MSTATSFRKVPDSLRRWIVTIAYGDVHHRVEDRKFLDDLTKLQELVSDDLWSEVDVSVRQNARHYWRWLATFKMPQSTGEGDVELLLNEVSELDEFVTEAVNNRTFVSVELKRNPAAFGSCVDVSELDDFD